MIISRYELLSNNRSLNLNKKECKFYNGYIFFGRIDERTRLYITRDAFHLSTSDWWPLMSGGANLPQPAATAVMPVNSWSGEGRQIGETDGDIDKWKT